MISFATKSSIGFLLYENVNTFFDIKVHAFKDFFLVSPYNSYMYLFIGINVFI
jgi:hypothetical protein